MCPSVVDFHYHTLTITHINGNYKMQSHNFWCDGKLNSKFIKFDSKNVINAQFKCFFFVHQKQPRKKEKNIAIVDVVSFRCIWLWIEPSTRCLYSFMYVLICTWCFFSSFSLILLLLTHRTQVRFDCFCSLLLYCLYTKYCWIVLFFLSSPTIVSQAIIIMQ